MKKLTVAFMLLFSANVLAAADSWKCDGIVTKYFPKQDVNSSKGGNTETRAASPEAAIKALDPALNAKPNTKNVCSIQSTLNKKFENTAAKWPNKYAWITHWKVKEDGVTLERVTDYYSYANTNSFNDTFMHIMNAEAQFPFTKDSSMIGCFYQCEVVK